MIFVPVALTLSRIALIPFVLYYLFVSPHLGIGITLYTIGLLSDSLDGMAARYFSVVSEWGKFWDPLADKLFLWSFFAGAASTGLIGWWVVVLFVLRDFLVTLARMYALRTGRAFVTSQVAKYKTFVQCMLGYVLLARQANLIGEPVVSIMVGVALALSWYSAFMYVVTFPKKG